MHAPSFPRAARLVIVALVVLAAALAADLAVALLDRHPTTALAAVVPDVERALTDTDDIELPPLPVSGSRVLPGGS